jgi:PhzF family phenazine biosynthesis protein
VDDPAANIMLVDAFTATAFAGNPAAVCRLSRTRDSRWMQALAAELRMPATCFISEIDGRYGLRWFSTEAELVLCGHGTLASAHMLLSEGLSAGNEIVRFETVAGVMTCRREGDWIAMDFPAEAPSPVADPPAALIDALGARRVMVARNRYDYLVEVDTAAAVAALRPDLTLLMRIPTRGVIVTARCDDGTCDFVSRFFAIVHGGAEDQVTGSAHCALGPYWGERLAKDDLTGRQLSRRGGVVRVRTRGERVDLLGQAVTVARGTLAI